MHNDKKCNISLKMIMQRPYIFIIDDEFESTLGLFNRITHIKTIHTTKKKV